MRIMTALVEAPTTPQSLKFPPLERVLNTSRNQPNTNTEPNIPSSAAARCMLEVSRRAITSVKPVKHKTKTRRRTGARGGRKTFRLAGEMAGLCGGRVGGLPAGLGLDPRGADAFVITKIIPLMGPPS